MLYERVFSTAHILIWGAMAFLFEVAWCLTTHHHAPLWARLCAAGAASYWVRPIEAALARRHARRTATARRP
ncbi:hypothetical protein [Streptomyces violascens]|uniref:hypothetical protein n=1 Tax=Streptomyces violascens TaxID=67381 RepID=UPI0016738264|nr:hypothetical protein [Streptomyces violascens]GGU38803.1 hypothetical protein GCM10010289_69620 [Streptomyces violascens]